MRVFAIVVATCLCVACAPAPKVVREEPPPPPPPQPLRVWSAWPALADREAPERDQVRDAYRYLRELDVTDIKGFRYMSYRPAGRKEIVGFSLVNDGSSRVNPRGLKVAGAQRMYIFAFPDRARENIYLTINDDVNLSGRFSYDNMYREMLFFPRIELPTVEKVNDGALLKVTLPTGEPVLFDAKTKEIVGGVLREEPIDFNRNRFARHNPGIRYEGQHMVITVAQRGEAPRRARVWGQTKYAEVYYPAKYAKACRISPRLLFDQRPKKGDTDPKLTMLHATDASLFRTIEKQCGWNLTELALAASTGQQALAAHTGQPQAQAAVE